MFPERAVHLIGGEPGLRSHFEDVGRLTLARDRAHEVVGEIRIRPRDIVVQRGALAERGSSASLPSLSLASIFYVTRTTARNDADGKNGKEASVKIKAEPGQECFVHVSKDVLALTRPERAQINFPTLQVNPANVHER